MTLEYFLTIQNCQTPIKHALLAEGVELEELGGDVPCVEVSGLSGMGLDKLVETLATLAEIKELRGRVEGLAEGRVLESRVDKGRGSALLCHVYHNTWHLISSFAEKVCCDGFGYEWYPKVRLLRGCRYDMGETAPDDGFNRETNSLCISWHSGDCLGLEGTSPGWR